MSYSETTLLFDLKRLPVDTVSKWVWEAQKGQFGHADALGRLKTRTPVTAEELRQRALLEIHRYCWFIYQKTSTDGGRQIIGREWDTDPYSLSSANIHGVAHGGYDRVGDGWQRRGSGHGAAGLNLSPGARGNVLKMDKWHPCMNDCWVLGGIHRGATFMLVSPRTPENIWNSNGYFIVTAREILGLLHFGYETKREGDKVLFIQKDRGRAAGANIVEYDRMVRERSALGAGNIRLMLDTELKAGLHAELLRFDRSALRHVVVR